ncbi:MAG: xanthine dehydrogenase family protein subunit M [Gammaproteobacteria bacterium]|nr:xanthine dehydrogenase family protein subunit M [Gammaproteobacteria bacterium]
MHDFQFVTPGTLNEALKLLAKHGASAQLLAGGTDLIVKMRVRHARPDLVLDAKHIPELNVLKLDGTGLTIGAAVSCRSIYLDERIAARYPALVDCTALIGGIQIQGRATVGGNLCNAAPSADTIPALIALGAMAHLRGPKGKRQLPVEKFCLGPGKTALRKGEMLIHVRIPKPAKNSGAFFLRFIPRNEMDIAVVNAAAAVVLDARKTKFISARIAIGAAAPTPLYVEDAGAVLADEPVSENMIAEAARIASDAVRPITDMRGTIEQRRDLAAVLTARALRGAIDRAKRGNR